MYFSLRVVLWQWFFGGGEPPLWSWTAGEIGVSLLIAAVLGVIVYLVARRLFFLICERGKMAKNAALLYAILIAVFILIATLELLGLSSTFIALLLFVVYTLGEIVYLYSKK